MEEQKERHATLLADLGRLNHHQGLLAEEGREACKEAVELGDQDALATAQVESLSTVVEQLKLEVPIPGMSRPKV